MNQADANPYDAIEAVAALRLADGESLLVRLAAGTMPEHAERVGRALVDRFPHLKGRILMIWGDSEIEELPRDALLDLLGVPEDRRHPWHVITIRDVGWHMAHPITCELAGCPYDGTADRLLGAYPPGVYDWDEDGVRPH